MKTTLRVPDKIRIGYQDREGTYTKKLGYVIYYDERGKLRKETSWKGWIGHDMGDFDNEPQSGFVLNKGAGGVGSGYYHDRTEKIRIYDPRDFEIEITVGNLMFILSHCTSIKGKGIEGDFVYAWDGKDMILLPTDCPDYKQCKEYSDNLKGRVTKKEMFEGHLYKNKDMQTLMYLGRHEIYDVVDDKIGGYLGKVHCFHNMESGKKVYEKGFTRLTQKLTEEAHEDYADIYTNFYESQLVDQIEEAYFEEETVTLDKLIRLTNARGNWTERKMFIGVMDGGYYRSYDLNYFSTKHMYYSSYRKEIVQGVEVSPKPMSSKDIIKELGKNNLFTRWGAIDLYVYNDTNRNLTTTIYKPRIKMKSGKILGVQYYV